MTQQILVSEIHPNPESGSEWIELLLVEESSENLDLNDYTIFDNTRQIYQFSNEQFINQLLVIEISGLNNDTDSVILKDNNGNILDSFTYQTTKKGWSWSRQKESNNFILTEPSKNQINPSITLTPTPTSSTPSLSPTLSQNITTSPTPQPSLTNQPVQNPPKQYHYDLSKIKLDGADKNFEERQTRLVLLSKDQGQMEILNAIIGSSLIILSAIFLIYAKFKFRNN